MKHSLVLAALGLFMATAHGADLVSVYQLASQNDPQLKVAQSTREATREAKPIARAQLLPNFSASANLAAVNQDIKDSATGASDDSFARRGLTFNVTQPLFRKNRLIQLEQAEVQLQQADMDYRLAEQDLMLRVAQSYFGVLSAQEDVIFAKSEIKAIERQLDQAQQRFDVGLVAITDVHEAQARYDQSTANEISANNLLDNSKESLREIIGEIPDMLAGLKKSVPLAAPVPVSLDKWSETAQQHNPGIQSARFDTDLARKNIELNRAGHYPTLDLVGSYGLARSDARNGSDTNTGEIGLQLAVPIWSGGGVTAATRQASAQYHAAQHGLDQQRRAVERQVRNAHRGVQSSISRVKALQASQVSAKSALEATEAGFDAGTRTLVDVLNSQRDLFRAKRDYAQSRYEYILNTLSLLQATGTLTVEDLQRVNGWLE